MNVALHSAFGLVYLLFASLVCGIVLSLIRAFLNSGSSIIAAIVCKRFPTYKAFSVYAKSRKSSFKAIILADFLTCILFASLVLCVSFIFNSGNFRILSVAVMLAGLAIGHMILKGIINELVLLILFVIKWIINIASFPFILVGQRIVKIIIKLLGRIKSRRNNKLIQKYTAFCFEKIEKNAEYGLIDDYYKELIK